MKTDNEVLTRCIEQCFELSMDAELSDDQQAKFLALGKRLRGSLLNLLSAHFPDGTAAVTAANNDLGRANQALDTATQDLAKAGTVLDQVTKLVGTLDGLLSIAANFI